jgi:hypothetical protein
MSLSELLLYGLIVTAVVVFNYMTQRAARKRQEEARQAEAAAAVEVVDDHAWGRRPAPGVPAGAEEVPQYAQYEWGTRPEAAVPWPIKRIEVERSRNVPPVTPAALQVQEARSRIEAERRTRPESRRGIEARRLFGNRQDLRRAVIAMTVLGPCRALEPPDLQDASRPLPR